MAPADAPGGRNNDLRFRVLELRRDPAGVASEDRAVLIEAPEVGDARPTGEPARVHLHLETVSGGVRVDGTVDFDWEGSCRRCLEPALGSATSEFSELFVDDPQAWVASGDGEDDEPQPITDGWVDLSGVVRDCVLVGLPLAPLCREDCEGPSPDQFPVGVEDEGTGAQDAPAVPDPRWAKLSEVTFDDDAD